jgi:hypothetical protein
MALFRVFGAPRLRDEEAAAVRDDDDDDDDGCCCCGRAVTPASSTRSSSSSGGGGDSDESELTESWSSGRTEPIGGKASLYSEQCLRARARRELC